MTYYIGQNQDPPDESTGTRPDEDTTLDPAAFQGGLPVGTGGTYFILRYFAGQYFVPNYFPGDNNNFIESAQLLYPRYRALFTSGLPSITISMQDAYVAIDAIVIDTPPTGITQLDLIDATATFSLQNVLSSTPAINGNGAIIVEPQATQTVGVPETAIKLSSVTSLNECVYFITPADMLLLTPGKYIGSFTIFFPSNAIITFGGLPIYVVSGQYS